MRRLKPFLHDEKGSATIEFILWIPVIVALLVIVIDATTLYVTHKEMWNVARDAARRIVTNPAKYDEDRVNDYIFASVNLRDFPYAACSAYDSATGSEVMIQLRVNDMSVLGYSPLTIVGLNMTARVAMRADPNAPATTAWDGC